MMKRDPNKTVAIEFDQQGVEEVSEQIMDSYNSGFINEDKRSTEDNDVLVE